MAGISLTRGVQRLVSQLIIYSTTDIKYAGDLLLQQTKISAPVENMIPDRSEFFCT
jgi:hypothetical protein